MAPPPTGDHAAAPRHHAGGARPETPAERPGGAPEHEPQNAVAAAAEAVGGAVETVARAVKPGLRGWIHAGMAPVSLLLGLTLVALGPTTTARVTAAVFTLTTTVMFASSGVYHRGTWSERAAAGLRRLDHSNILLVIAGTYTPLAALLLPRRTATWFLLAIWVGTLGGIAARILWLRAPRWFYVTLYLGLGWVAIGLMPTFWAGGHEAVVWLVAGGGLAYTVGAVIYAMKRPNPSPRWFGFHEIFHVLTVVGYLCHLAAVAVATFA